MRVLFVVGYTFAAWLACGFFVFAGYKYLSRPGQVLVHCLSIPLCFAPVFRLYFKGPAPLPPLRAALLAAGFIVLLDLFLVAPYFLHTADFFKSWWDWQLPALILIATVVATGRACAR